MGPDEVMKHRCCKCQSLAVWDYMPDGERPEAECYFCDACVSRGCSCNWDEETGTEDRDELGRQLPCCEYAYNKEGFDIET